VFNISSDSGRLRVTEVVLGDEARCVGVTTDLACKSHDNECILCTPLGEDILVMAGRGKGVFAALVSVDGGLPSKATIHVTELAVKGLNEWPDHSFLCPLSEKRALLCSHGGNRMWYCDVKRALLITKELAVKAAATGDFDAVPIYFSDGALLVLQQNLSSTNLVLFRYDGELRLEKIGEISGERRRDTSITLIGGRFLVRFGGQTRDTLDDLWIFDLETHKGSPVENNGEWHPADKLVFLVVQENTLYLVGRSIFSISLGALSELIQDVDFQAGFQVTLALKPTGNAPVDRGNETVRGMRKLEGHFCDYFSYNTISHQERVFHFSCDEQKLSVTEILFGPRLKTKTVHTEVSCGSTDGGSVSCCSFGDTILVLAGWCGAAAIFCALVSIDPGELTKESVHLEEKEVVGREKYGTTYLLTQISENKVWASSHFSTEVWIGEIKGKQMLMTCHPSPLITTRGIEAPPLCLPDGRLLMVGKWWPASTVVVLVALGEQLFSEKVGDFPGEARDGMSIVLLAKRFVVAFGGCDGDYRNDIWIFDTKTRVASLLEREGDWSPPTHWPALLVRGQELYIIGGRKATAIHSISLTSLSRLIVDDKVRRVFCNSLGFPLRPKCDRKKPRKYEYPVSKL